MNFSTVKVTLETPRGAVEAVGTVTEEALETLDPLLTITVSNPEFLGNSEGVPSQIEFTEHVERAYLEKEDGADDHYVCTKPIKVDWPK